VTFAPPYSHPSGTDTNYLPNCDQMLPVIADMFKVTPKCIQQAAKAPPPGDSGGNSGNGGSGNGGKGSGGGGKGGKGGGGKGGGGKGGKSFIGTNEAFMGPVLSDAAQAAQNARLVDPINGTRSLLDLMFMVVFGSIDAAQV
jgi:hypothetical protein